MKRRGISQYDACELVKKWKALKEKEDLKRRERNEENRAKRLKEMRINVRDESNTGTT
jgi:hypothetical protein